MASATLPPVGTTRGAGADMALSRSWSEPGGFGDTQSSFGFPGDTQSSFLKSYSLRTSPKRSTGFPKGFLERQASHPSTEARRALAERRKDFVQERHEKENNTFPGSQGVEGFRSYLKHRFGSIVAGWRELDLDGNGRLSFQEFFIACRRHGFSGNLRQLWHQLETSGDGFISIAEIDPEVAKTVGEFKLALLTKYGDMLSAWRKAIDKQSKGHVTEPDLEACIKDLGLDMSSKKLYGMLSKGGLGITLAEFDPMAHRRWVTSDFDGVNEQRDDEFVAALPETGSSVPWPKDVVVHKYKDSGGRPEGVGPRAWRAALNKQAHDEAKAELHTISKMRLGLHNPDGFKKALVGRCGSLFGGWRHAIDVHNNGRVTFGEFCQALHRLAFHGDVKGLWEQLDLKLNGYIEFGDIDPETHEQITELRQKLTEVYGNLLLAWLKGMDTNQSNKVDEKEFVTCCKKVGFSGDAKRLFDLLKPGPSRAWLSLHDFDFNAHQSLLRGDFRMLTQDLEQRPPRLAPPDIGFGDRRSVGSKWEIVASQKASHTGEFSSTVRAFINPEVSRDIGEDLFALAARSCGSLIATWRLALNPSHKEKLNFPLFCAGARRLGFGGDLMSVWATMDTEKRGFIVLRDFDPESDTLLRGVVGAIEETYGDLEGMWARCFKKDVHKRMDRKDVGLLSKALKLGDKGLVAKGASVEKKLWKALQPVLLQTQVSLHEIRPLFDIFAKRPPKSDSKPGAPWGSKSAAALSANASATGSASGSVNGALVESSGPAVHADLGVGSGAPPPANILSAGKLRSAMITQFGSTSLAWRTCFDGPGRGFAGNPQFLQGARRCNVHGNLSLLWQELVGDREGLRYEDVDPAAKAQLVECRTKLLDAHGTLYEAWLEAIDPGVGHADQEDFVEAMEMAGIGREREWVVRLFILLKGREGQRSLKVDDLKALMIGVPKKDQEAMFGAPPPPHEPNLREFAESALEAHHGSDHIVRTLDGFKRMLVHKFGSYLAGWRQALDVDHNGIVTSKEFCDCCRQLGLRRVRPLWKEIDANQRGQVTLRDLDAETADAFSQLEQLLIERHGSTRAGWNAIFDPERMQRCSKEYFVAQGQALGLEDPPRLYKLLVPYQGAIFIAYSDLWADLNKNKFDTRHVDYKSPVRTLKPGMTMTQ